MEKTPSFEGEEGGCRQTPPSTLGFGGSCSSIVVLTTSLITRGLKFKVIYIIKHCFIGFPNTMQEVG